MKKSAVTNYAGIATILGFFLACFVYFYPPSTPTSYDQKILGIWLSSYTIPQTGGSLQVNGTTEFFQNGSYNFVGQIEINVDEKDIKVLYDVDVTGDWTKDSDTLVTKLIDVKSYPKTVVYHSKIINARDIEDFNNKKLENLDNVYPKGISEKYKVLSLGKKSMLLEAIDLKGNPLNITMLKQSKRFQRNS